MSDANAQPPQVKISWLFWTLVGFLLFVVVGLVTSSVSHNTTDYDQERAKVRYATLAALQASENQTLTTAAWVDKSKNTIRIPIQEAMALEIETLKSKTPQAGCLIPGVTPPPAPAAAPEPAPAAPAPVAATNAAPAKPTPPAKKN